MKALRPLILAATILLGLDAHADEETLRVGIDPYFAPYEYIDQKGNLRGFDLDVLKAISSHMGFKFEIRQYPFSELMYAITSHQVDLAISALVITPERSEIVDFTTPYFRAQLSFLARAKDQNRFRYIKDIANQRLCVQSESSSAYKGSSYTQNLVAVVDIFEGIDKLGAGECDVLLDDRFVNLFYLNNNPKAPFVELQETLPDEDCGIAVAKDNPGLL
ncbi:MAG: transporter substrate-binding domain-containing protein, partial [Succinivibrionaceae bacterium]|nr:transporter substrate-binding domain-containing protein [Succinivibrionaceae bacterium]